MFNNFYNKIEGEVFDNFKNIISGQVYLPTTFKYLIKLIIRSERDGQPICLSKKQKENLKKLLSRALNKNQILILSEILNNSQTITSMLTNLSETTKIPLSTLKFNTKVLNQLGLISFKNSSNAKLTDFGKFVFVLIGGDDPR